MKSVEELRNLILAAIISAKPQQVEAAIELIQRDALQTAIDVCGVLGGECNCQLLIRAILPEEEWGNENP